MKKIVPIIRLTQDFATIIRTIGYRKGHFENDAEHSYQLALVCWQANDQYQLGLDNEKLLKYALVHDLVEVYAGDTDAHGDEEALRLKPEKEKQAFEQLKKEYASYSSMLEHIERYEHKADDEARFVKIIDKCVPDINIFDSKSDYYRSKQITFDDWKQWMTKKVQYDTLPPKLKSFVDQRIEDMRETYSEIFYQA